MKKLIAFLFLISVFFLVCQTSFSQPKLIIHVYGGGILPLPDLKGDLPASPVATSFETSYGMRVGFNIGADGKYAFDKNGNFRGVLGFAYNSIINPVEYSSGLGSYKYKPTINILTLSLGGEYAITPKKKVSGFFGVDLTANFFSGSFNYDPPLLILPNVSLKSATRFGFDIGIGSDFSLSKSVGLVVGVKYSLANLIGKSSDTTVSLNATDRSLNDASYTMNGVAVNSKNISFIQVYAGVSFFLLQPKTVKK